MNVQLPLAPSADDAGYRADFHAWALAQAALLRAARPDGLDWENVAEEIEDLAQSQERELASRLGTIIEHLLKYEYGRLRDPAAGWEDSIVEQRLRLEKLLRKNSSLARKIEDELEWCFRYGRRKALSGFKQYEPDALNMYRKALPTALPYTVEQLLDEDYLPDPVAG